MVGHDGIAEVRFDHVVYADNIDIVLQKNVSFPVLKNVTNRMSVWVYDYFVYL